MNLKRIGQGALFIIILSSLIGLGVNYSLIHKYFQGEFRRSFFSSEDYPSMTFIALSEAEELFVQKTAVFIDSRSKEDYAQGHILGALNIPFEEQKERDILVQLSFPIEQTLVVYCDGDECQSSVELAKILHERGFLSIKVFFGGWAEWVKASLPAGVEDDSK